jgi:hypothetical protein
LGASLVEKGQGKSAKPHGFQIRRKISAGSIRRQKMMRDPTYSANASARLFAAYVCQRTEIYSRKA